MIMQDAVRPETGVAYVVDERPRIASEEIIRAKCGRHKIVLKILYENSHQINNITILVNKKPIEREEIEKIRIQLKGRNLNGASINSCRPPYQKESVGMTFFSEVSFKTVSVVADILFKDGKWRVGWVSDNPFVPTTFMRFDPQLHAAPQ